jgi:amino acid transporter
VGGLLSLAGALANAELGRCTRTPAATTSTCARPTTRRLVGWLSFLVIYTGTVATLAIRFAAGLRPFVTLGPTQELLVAVAVIVATTAVNYVSVPAGARFNNLTG